MRQLAADHIREMHAKAEHERLAHQARRARRRAPSTRRRQSVIGQVAACNAVSFYRLANAEIARGILRVPAVPFLVK